MTKEELVKKVAEKSGIDENEALTIINAFTDQIKDQLSKGEKVSIAGFGTFVLSQRKAKTFVNPKTGTSHDIPDRVLPHFKASGDFKKNIRKEI
jgi:DNA-binding protein HU-beta